MAKGKKTGGRVKGSKNRKASIIEAIRLTYEGIGGDKSFRKWALLNQTDFYTKVMPRVIPSELVGPSSGEPLPLRIELTHGLTSSSGTE